MLACLWNVWNRNDDFVGNHPKSTWYGICGYPLASAKGRFLQKIETALASERPTWLLKCQFLHLRA
jgi:hypothetical protein